MIAHLPAVIRNCSNSLAILNPNTAMSAHVGCGAIGHINYLRGDVQENERYKVRISGGTLGF